MTKIINLIEKIIDMTRENVIEWGEGSDSSRPFFQFFTNTFRVKFYPMIQLSGNAVRYLGSREIVFLNSKGEIITSVTEKYSDEAAILLNILQDKIMTQKEHKIDNEIDKISREIEEIPLSKVPF